VGKIKEVYLRGIKNIKRVVMRKEGEEYVIYTEGSNLKEVLKIDGVDIVKSKTNDILEISKVLGIEAARNAIINEALDTLDEQGLRVDVRHIMLISDMMSVDGTVKSIGRHGVSGEKASVLARAAFEITVDHLLKAGVRGEVEKLSGIVENVIVGRPVMLGTGMVDLVMKRASHD
jgi:DNA-directed RNA polymerase subunit A"